MTTAPTPRLIGVGLGVVLTAAAALSFSALYELGTTVGMHLWLAWLLPVCVDAGAAVSCGTWLSRRVPQDAARFARSMTWSLLAVTVVGNAGHLGMHAHGIIPPWWVVVLVGAIPPAVAGATVHLAVLVGRPVAAVETAPETSPGPVTVADEVVARRSALHAVPTPENGIPTPPHGIPVVHDEDEIARAERLISEGVGRPRLARELGIKDHQARALLAAPAEVRVLLPRYRETRQA